MNMDLATYRARIENIQKSVSSQYAQIGRNTNKARVIENLRSAPTTQNVKEEELTI